MDSLDLHLLNLNYKFRNQKIFITTFMMKKPKAISNNYSTNETKT
jgi:hypothetical protein